MGIGKITSREFVLKAIDIFNQLGEEEFLKRYGYWSSKRVLLGI